MGIGSINVTRFPNAILRGPGWDDLEANSQATTELFKGLSQFVKGAENMRNESAKADLQRDINNANGDADLISKIINNRATEIEENKPTGVMGVLNAFNPWGKPTGLPAEYQGVQNSLLQDASRSPLERQMIQSKNAYYGQPRGSANNSNQSLSQNTYYTSLIKERDNLSKQQNEYASYYTGEDLAADPTYIDYSGRLNELNGIIEQINHANFPQYYQRPAGGSVNPGGGSVNPGPAAANPLGLNNELLDSLNKFDLNRK